jgi:NTP pyrophosphatase (non-canonical NTP hydrolase)
MNKHEYLLTCLAEECNEVAQRISKALRFGLDEVQPDQPLNNRERITEELHDLNAVAVLCERAGLVISVMPNERTIERKRSKIEYFKRISRNQGTLQEPA